MNTGAMKLFALYVGQREDSFVTLRSREAWYPRYPTESQAAEDCRAFREEFDSLLSGYFLPEGY